jgi:hypothetical protein
VLKLACRRTQFPLADKWVLSKAEVAELKKGDGRLQCKIKVATAKD